MLRDFLKGETAEELSREIDAKMARLDELGRGIRARGQCTDAEREEVKAITALFDEPEFMRVLYKQELWKLQRAEEERDAAKRDLKREHKRDWFTMVDEMTIYL